ncbi:hypothetical protein, partial [Desulfovibrio porci]|uniref:hypothetical protein n=1 Tax=Desulfovibrio porci TaxID=2605782 RepID=UPI003A94E20B
YIELTDLVVRRNFAPTVCTGQGSIWYLIEMTYNLCGEKSAEGVSGSLGICGARNKRNGA